MKEVLNAAGGKLARHREKILHDSSRKEGGGDLKSEVKNEETITNESNLRVHIYHKADGTSQHW